jgi:hypothetical protein
MTAKAKMKAARTKSKANPIQDKSGASVGKEMDAMYTQEGVPDKLAPTSEPAAADVSLGDLPNPSEHHVDDSISQNQEQFDVLPATANGVEISLEKSTPSIVPPELSALRITREPASVTTTFQPNSNAAGPASSLSTTVVTEGGTSGSNNGTDSVQGRFIKKSSDLRL